MQEKKTKIIIGAGLGGLIHGILHKKARPSDRVVIYDLNKIPGGFCTSFKKISNYDGEKIVYTVNIPLITSDFNPGEPLEEFLKYLGVKNLNWKAIDNLFEYYPLEGEPYVLRKDNVEDLINLSDDEKEKESVRKFFAIMKQFYNDLMNKAQINPEPLDAIRLLFTIPSTILRILNDTDYLSTVEKLGIKTPIIKEILRCPEAFMGAEADVVSAAGEISMIQSFLQNTSLQPHNGDSFQTLSDRIAERFVELGGELILGTKVDHIVFDKKKATGISINGEFVPADSVVLSVAQDSIKPLLKYGEHIPQIKSRIKKIKSLPPPNSDYYCYYLIDKKVVEEKPELLNTAYHIYKLHDDNGIDNWKLPIWVPDELINDKYYVLTLIVTEKDQSKIDYWMELRAKDYRKYVEEKEKVAAKFLEVLQSVEPVFKKHPPLKHLMTMSPASYLPYGSKYPISGLAQTPKNFGMNRMTPCILDNLFLSSNANFTCGVWGAIAGSWQGFVASYEREYGIKIGNHDILYKPSLKNLPE